MVLNMCLIQWGRVGQQLIGLFSFIVPMAKAKVASHAVVFRGVVLPSSPGVEGYNKKGVSLGS